MPIYLAHGFRWPREGFTGIRVHAIVHNLEDCSVEYIQNENSRNELLASFRKAHPQIMKELESPTMAPSASTTAFAVPSQSGRRIDFLEQYDPDNLGPEAVSQPYAYVCDRVVMIAGGRDAALHASKLGQGSPPSTSGNPPSSSGSRDGKTPTAGSGSSGSGAPKQRVTTQAMSRAAPFNSPATYTALSVNIEDVISDGPGMSTQAWEAMADLRDQLAKGEKIGWWVIYNGDPDREYDDDTEDDSGDEDDEIYEDTGDETERGYREEYEYDDEDEGGEEVLLYSRGSGGAAPIEPMSATLFPTREESLHPPGPSSEKEVAPKSLAKPLGGKIGTGRRPPPVAPAQVSAAAAAATGTSATSIIPGPASGPAPTSTTTTAQPRASTSSPPPQFTSIPKNHIAAQANIPSQSSSPPKQPISQAPATSSFVLPRDKGLPTPSNTTRTVSGTPLPSVIRSVSNQSVPQSTTAKEESHPTMQQGEAQAQPQPLSQQAALHSAQIQPQTHDQKSTQQPAPPQSVPQPPPQQTPVKEKPGTTAESPVSPLSTKTKEKDTPTTKSPSLRKKFFSRRS